MHRVQLHNNIVPDQFLACGLTPVFISVIILLQEGCLVPYSVFISSLVFRYFNPAGLRGFITSEGPLL